MNESEFIKKLEEKGLNKIEITTYYGLNDDGQILLDEDSIREEFEDKLKQIIKIADEEDKILREFYIKRFNKKPEEETEKEYFEEWKQRFETGHPENFMDSESLKIYEKIKSDRNKK